MAAHLNHLYKIYFGLIQRSFKYKNLQYHDETNIEI